jgi:hypothetical protein
MSQLQVNRFVGLLRDTFSRLESLPVPTIAALDGTSFLKMRIDQVHRSCIGRRV